jgi:hypothetical protein
MSAESAKVISINPEAELEQKSLTLYEQATSLSITDQRSYAAAGEVGKSLKALEKEITDYFAPMKKAAHDAHKAITKKESDELGPVKEALDIVRRTMNIWVQEQERIRKEAERKARMEAEEAARKERERLEAQAMKAMEKGKDEKAEELLDRAENVYAAPVTVAPVVDKTVRTESGNITQARELQVTVTDAKAFIAELVKRNMAPTMVEIKPMALKSWVKANGLEAFPGLHINQTVSVRL